MKMIPVSEQCFREPDMFNDSQDLDLLIQVSQIILGTQMLDPNDYAAAWHPVVASAAALCQSGSCIDPVQRQFRILVY